MQIRIALIPLNYLNLCDLRVEITWQRYHQNICVFTAFISINKKLYILKICL
jgi:hypothetical protein